MWVVMTGDICGGFTFHGPWDDGFKALEWVENQKYDSWEVIALEKPE